MTMLRISAGNFTCGNWLYLYHPQPVRQANPYIRFSWVEHSYLKGGDKALSHITNSLQNSNLLSESTLKSEMSSLKLSPFQSYRLPQQGNPPISALRS